WRGDRLRGTAAQQAPVRRALPLRRLRGARQPAADRRTLVAAGSARYLAALSRGGSERGRGPARLGLGRGVGSAGARTAAEVGHNDSITVPLAGRDREWSRSLLAAEPGRA